MEENREDRQLEVYWLCMCSCVCARGRRSNKRKEARKNSQTVLDGEV